MALCSKAAGGGCDGATRSPHPGSARAALLPQDARLHVVALRCRPGGVGRSAWPQPGCPEKADAFFHFAWAHTIGPGRNDMPAQIENIRYTIAAVPHRGGTGLPVFIGAGSQAEYGRVEGVLTAPIPPPSRRTATVWLSCAQAR